MPDEHLFPDLPNPATVAEIVTDASHAIGSARVRDAPASNSMLCNRL